jgi:Ca2+-binding RTX toxin-like protein
MGRGSDTLLSSAPLRRVMGMRRTVLLLASTALAILLISGAAYAITKDCTAGADYCIGTNNSDTLNGSDVRDKIHGLDGNDTLLGNGGDDGLVGGKGNDLIRGGEGSDGVGSNNGPGADKIYAEGGDDSSLEDTSFRCGRDGDCVNDRNVIDGGEGNDYIYGNYKVFGGPGNDSLYAWDSALNFDGMQRNTIILNGGGGFDLLRGSYSKDTIYAQDGEEDNISCASGTDTVYFDEGVDSVNPLNCEHRISTPQ